MFTTPVVPEFPDNSFANEVALASDLPLGEVVEITKLLHVAIT